MRIGTLLVICLSLCGFTKCESKEFADKPAGWNCTYFFDNENSPFLLIQEIKKAQTQEEINVLIERLKSLPADRTQFVCNGIKYPDSTKQFHFADPEIQKARCMPLKTANAYDNYLRDKIQKLEQRCQ